MPATLLQKINKLLSSPGWVLLFVIIFSVAYFIFAHEGFYWIDDYGYAKYAWEVKTGTFSITQNSDFHPNNPLTHRVMIFVPVAFFYGLFGINIYSTTLWPLLCTVGCSGIIYLLYQKENPKIAVLGMILLGLYFHSLFLASYLYPDNILMFFAFAAAAVLYFQRYRAAGKNQVFMALLFVLANFLAFLSKETIIYFLPFYFWVFGLDFFRKKHTVFWAWSIGFGILLLAAYLTYYHFRAGDWLYRFHIIEKTNLDMQDGNFIKASGQSLLNRITIGPLYFFIGSGIVIPFVFALGLFQKFKVREFAGLKSQEYFWLGLAIVVLGQFWFGSTSLSFYNPITLLPRMVTIAMPPLCLAGAYGLQNLETFDRKSAAFFSLCFGLICALDRSNTLIMYVPLALFFAGSWYRFGKPENKFYFGILVLVLIAVHSFRPLHFMRKPTVMAFQEQDEIVKKYLNKNQGKNLVLGDRWLDFIYDFHYQFEANPHYKYQQFLVPADFSQYNHVYLLVNHGSLTNPEMTKWQQVQEPEINEKFPRKKLVAQEGMVQLFQLK